MIAYFKYLLNKKNKKKNNDMYYLKYVKTIFINLYICTFI